MSSEHLVTSYDKDLSRLDNIIAEMGGRAEAQLADSVKALVKRDQELAVSVIASDRTVDQLEREVDRFATRLLALRQPKAIDLRHVVAAFKIASDLERIGDYAKNIAKRTAVLGRVTLLATTTGTLERMGRIVQIMITDVLDAYIQRDAQKARDVMRRDQEVDQLNTSLFRELLTYMMEDPRNITPSTHLLFIAKNLERMGDHTTNIAEQVHFIVSGEEPELDRPKKDASSVTFVEPKEAG